MSIFFTAKVAPANEDGLHFEGFSLSDRTLPKWNTLNRIEEMSEKEVTPANIYEVKGKAPESNRSIYTGFLSLLVLLSYSFIVSFSIFFDRLSNRGVARTLLGCNIVATMVFCGDSLAEYGFKGLRAFSILSIFPIASIFYMVLGGSNSEVYALLLVLPVSRFSQMSRYNKVVLRGIKPLVAHPSKEIVRLANIFVVIVFMFINFSAGIHWHLASDQNQTSWMIADEIQNNSTEKVLMDSWNYDDLLWVRSVYFCVQSILTIGYGDVAPYSESGKLFACFLCLVGVFILAYLISNLSSYLGSMDSTASYRYRRLDEMERMMALKHIPFETRTLVRDQDIQNWNNYRGFNRVSFFNSLPLRIENLIIGNQLEKLQSIPLFRCRDSYDSSLLYYILKHCPLRTMVNGSSTCNKLEDRKLSILVKGSLDKSSKISEDQILAFSEFPQTLITGYVMGVSHFFGLSDFTGPMYRATGRAEFIDIDELHFRKIGSLFPNWDIQKMLDDFENGTATDDRLIQQRDLERPKMNISKEAAMRELQIATRRHQRISDTNESSNENLSWYQFEENSVHEIVWNFAVSAAAIYNVLMIPLRFVVPEHFPSVYIDFISDILLFMNEFIMRYAFVSSETSNDSDTSSILSHHKTHVGSGMSVAVIPDSEAIGKMLAVQAQFRRKRAFKKLAFRLKALAKSGLFLFSILCMIFVLTDKMSVQDFRIARIPFILYGILLFRIPFLIHKHWRAVRQRFAPEHSNENTTIDTSTLVTANLVLAFLCVAHFVACFGIVIIKNSTDALESRYVTGMYWALTTMTTVGFGDIAPMNGVDTFYTCLVATMGVIVYSICISFISSNLKDTNVSENNPAHHHACVSAYLAANETHQSIQEKALSYLEYEETNDIIQMKSLLGLREHSNSEGRVPCFSRKSIEYHLNNPTFFETREKSETIGRTEKLHLLEVVFIKRFIHNHELFQDVAMTYVKELALNVSFRIYSTGDLVTGPTNPETSFFVLGKGRAEERNKDIKLQDLSEGSTFGAKYLNFESRGPAMTTSLIAVSMCEFWVLERSVFLKLNHLFPLAKEQLESNLRAIQAKELKNCDVAETLKKGKLAKMAGAGDSVTMQTTRGLIFSVDSPVQQYWFGFMFCPLLLNMILVPLRIAFRPTMSFIGDYAFDLTLVVDVILRMRYFALEYRDGKIVDEQPDILYAYCRSFFGVCDMIAAFPLELIGVVIILAEGEVSSSTLALLRLNKLFRGVHLIDHIKMLGSHIRSQRTKNIVTICKLVMVLLLTAHWFACIVYISASSIGLLSLPGYALDITISRHYLVSLYFAVTTLTSVGYGDIYVSTPMEYSVVMAMFIVGGGLFSIIIANLEDIVAQSDSSSMLYQQMSSSRNTLMNVQSIPAKLRGKINEYAMTLWRRGKGLEEKEIMDFLNQRLREEILVKRFDESSLSNAPVLGASGILKCILGRAELLTYVPGSMLYELGEVAENMYFIVSGALELLSLDRATTYMTLESGGFVGHDGFFMEQNTYCASARSAKLSRVLRIDKSLLLAFLEDHPSFINEFLDQVAKLRSSVSVLNETKKNLGNKKVILMMMRNAAVETEKLKWYQLDKYIMMSGSDYHTIWHLILFCAIMYNAITIPVTITAYAPERSIEYPNYYTIFCQDIFAINIISDLVLFAHVIFTCTIISKFHRGNILKTSKSIMNSQGISTLIDFITVLPIDYIAVQVCSANPSESTYCGAWFRLSRLYWLAHVTQLFVIFEQVLDIRNIQIKSGYLHLAKLIFTVLLVAHFFASGFLFIFQNLEQVSSGSWLGTKYVDGLYFSIYTLTTVGYGNIIVDGAYEMAYSMILMIVGSFLCHAGITSTMCSINDVEDENAAVVRRHREAETNYLEKNSTPTSTKEAIEAFHEYRIEVGGVNEEEVMSKMNNGFAFEVKGFVVYRSLHAARENCMALRNFNHGMFRSLIKHLKNDIYLTNDIIYQEKDKLDKIVFVLSGDVALESNSEVNAPVVIFENPGILLPNKKWNATIHETVSAITICSCLVCDKSLYNDLSQYKPALGGLYANFRELLEHPIAVDSYTKFSKKRFSRENIEFLQAVEKYRATPKTDISRDRVATTIIKDFISLGASKEIQIDEKVRERTLAGYGENANELFDESFEKFLSTVERESLPQFLKSDEFEQLVNQVNKTLREKLLTNA